MTKKFTLNGSPKASPTHLLFFAVLTIHYSDMDKPRMCKNLFRLQLRRTWKEFSISSHLDYCNSLNTELTHSTLATPNGAKWNWNKRKTTFLTSTGYQGNTEFIFSFSYLFKALNGLAPHNTTEQFHSSLSGQSGHRHNYSLVHHSRLKTKCD